MQNCSAELVYPEKVAQIKKELARPHALKGKKAEKTVLTGFTGVIDSLLKAANNLIYISGQPVLMSAIYLQWIFTM